MNKETKKILGTLELLLESCPCINIPGHEDGGYIYPFIWETSKQGEFNPFNLSISKRWLKQTDDDVILSNWQEMQYLMSFHRFDLDMVEIKQKSRIIPDLFRLLSDNLQELEYFNLETGYNPVGLIFGKTIDGDWISVCPTVYRETHIRQEQISRTRQNQEYNLEEIGENTKCLISEVERIISKFGSIFLEGGDIHNYTCDHDYQMIYVAGKTKKLAVETILQASGILEISKFHSFYPDKQYFQEWEFVDELETQELMHQKYTQINQFFNQTFSDVMMYRFSFGYLENIYIIGETENSDRAGIYIKSEFVYNP